MRTGHRKWLLPATVLGGIALICFTLCLRTGQAGVMSPAQALSNLITWARLSIARALQLPLYLEREELIAAHPYYLETIARSKNTLMTFLSGAILALSGAVYQGVFRNPMAAPTMLGVASGVNLGLLILTMQFGLDAYLMIRQRYVWCYALALVMLGLVLALGRFAGRGRTSVTDMLLVGTVLTQMVNVVISYFRFLMDDVQLEVFQELTMRGFTSNVSMEGAAQSLLVLVLVMAAGGVPVLLMRFSFNALSFSDEEARSLGVRPAVMRAVSLLCVTLLMTAAVLHCGSVGILALVVPHLCRYWAGADFRRLYWSSALYGGLLLTACRAVSSLIYIEGYGSFPLGPIATLIAMPVLAFALAKGRRGWE